MQRDQNVGGGARGSGEKLERRSVGMTISATRRVRRNQPPVDRVVPPHYLSLSPSPPCNATAPCSPSPGGHPPPPLVREPTGGCSCRVHSRTRQRMGLSLGQSPFLKILSENGPQRTRSSITELLKAFEQSSKDGPRYLNQLEEIVKFASGGPSPSAYA